MEPNMNDYNPNINIPNTRTYTDYFTSYIGQRNLDHIYGKIDGVKTYGFNSYDAIAQPAQQVVQKTGELMGKAIDMGKGMPAAISSVYSLVPDYVNQHGKSIGRNILTIAANREDIINQSIKNVIQACPDTVKEKSKEIGLKVGDGMDLTEGAVTLLSDVIGDYISLVKPLASGFKTLNTASEYLFDRKKNEDPKKFFISTITGEPQDCSDSSKVQSKL